MEHHTTYLGQLRLDPPLSAPELEWLRSFAEWGGGPTGDPFEVPMNPRAELADSPSWGGRPDPQGPSRTGIPAGVRDWVPCDEGCHLVWRPAPCSNDALLALRFLVDHYLGPRALARGRGPAFEAFTFDHRVDGVLAAHRDDTEELFLLRAQDGRFHRQTLDPGMTRWAGDAPVDPERGATAGGDGDAGAGSAGSSGSSGGADEAATPSRPSSSRTTPTSLGEGTVRDLVGARRPRTGARRGPGRRDR